MVKYRANFTNCQAPTYKFVNLTPPALSALGAFFALTGGDPMTIAPHQSTDKRFLGVIIPVALAAELKSTATARGTTASDLVRDALGHYLAIASNPQQSNKV